MKKKQKLNRLAALLCAAALLLSATPVTWATAPTLTVSSATAMAGSSCTVNVTATGLENLAALNFTVYYDADVFTLSYSSAAGMDAVESNANDAGQISYDGMSIAGVSGDVTLLTMSFQTASDTAAGSYPVTIAVGEAYDVSLTPQDISATSGTVTVPSTEETIQTVSLYTSCASAVQSGSDYTIMVYTHSTYNLAAGNFAFTYDSDLFEYKSLELLDTMNPSTSLYEVNSANPGYVLLSYASTEAATPYNLFKLTLTAKEVTENTGTSIQFVPSELYTVDNVALTASQQTISVTITPPEEEEPDYPDFRLDAPTQVATNETFVVAATLEGSSGLAAADFTINYDVNELECVSVTTYEAETGTDVASLVMTNPNISEGFVKFSFVNSDGISEDETLVYIRFRIKQNTALTISLTSSGTGLVDAEYGSVVLEYVPAEFTTYIPTFDVTFLDHDDTQLGETQTIPYLGSAVEPEVGGKAPTNDAHYVFSGWSESFSSVSKNMTVTAQYEAKDHSFGDWSSFSATQHQHTCSACPITTYAAHQWTEQNVCADCKMDGITVSLSEDETTLTAHLNHLNFGEEEAYLLDVSAAATAIVKLEGVALAQLEDTALTLQTERGEITFTGEAMSYILAATSDGAEIRIGRSEKDGLTIYTTAVSDSSGKAITLESGSVSLELSSVNACLAFAMNGTEKQRILPCTYADGAAVIELPENGVVAINLIAVGINETGVEVSFGVAPSDYSVIVAGYDVYGKMIGCEINDDDQRSNFALNGIGVDIVRIFFLNSACVPLIGQIEVVVN